MNFFGSNLVKYIEFVDREKLAAYYLTSKVFVLPSYSEGSPRVIIEAVSHGCKVVASNIISNKLISSDFNLNVCYYEQGNALDLATKIRQELKEESRNNIYHENQYVEAMADKVISFYHSLL